MSRRKSPLPCVREMQRRVDETFAGLINGAEVEAEICAAEAVIRAARRVLATYERRGGADSLESISTEAVALSRALARLDRASGRSE